MSRRNSLASTITGGIVAGAVGTFALDASTYADIALRGPLPRAPVRLVVGGQAFVVGPECVPAERAAGTHHPVARHDQRDRVRGVRHADRARGTRTAVPARELRVRDRRSRGDLAQSLPHVALKRCSAFGLDRDRVERVAVTVEVRREHVVHAPLIATRLLRGRLERRGAYDAVFDERTVRPEGELQYREVCCHESVLRLACQTDPDTRWRGPDLSIAMT